MADLESATRYREMAERNRIDARKATDEAVIAALHFAALHYEMLAEHLESELPV